MEFQTQILIIIFSIIFILLMFQLSSYLNMTILSTGMAVIEIEDFSKLTGIAESRIRMIPMTGNKVKFKILSEDEKEELSYTVFDLELIKIIESQNMEIEHEKILELRRLKFAHILRVPEELIKLSNDGNTFSQIEFNNQEEIIIGSVTFLEDNSVKEVTGKFKKLF